MGGSKLPHQQNIIREFKQRRPQRQRKFHPKSESALLQTSSLLFQLFQFYKILAIFSELNSKELYQSSGKEKESCCLVFPSSTKREIMHFHVGAVQRRQKMYKKAWSRSEFLFCQSKSLFTWRLGTPGRWGNMRRVPHLSCKRDQVKMRDYMDRRITSPPWGPPPPCKQALKLLLLCCSRWCGPRRRLRSLGSLLSDDDGDVNENVRRSRCHRRRLCLSSLLLQWTAVNSLPSNHAPTMDNFL